MAAEVKTERPIRKVFYDDEAKECKESPPSRGIRIPVVPNSSNLSLGVCV